MSSAQVQQAPYAGQGSPVSSRHYPPSADANYGQQTANASPTSSRRHTRRPSGNSNAAQHQQQQYYSPANTNNNSPAIQHHRHQQSTDYDSSIDNNSSGDYHRGQPPVAPPRTSSHNSRQSGAALAAAVSATPDRPSKSRGGQTADERAIHSARIATGDGSADAYHRENRQTNGYREKSYDSNTNKASQKSERSSRRAQQPPTEQVAQAQRSSRNQAQRTDTNVVQDTTDILARLVVSEPEVDLVREKERMAEATPHHYKAPEPVGGDGNGSGMQDEAIQHSPPGERRRQDHSQSKKEKNTRFGEYYLGNTLGEGEFGKVKMGWKQEGGVQVCSSTKIRASDARLTVNRSPSSLSAVTVLEVIPPAWRKFTAKSLSCAKSLTRISSVFMRWSRLRSILVSSLSTPRVESFSTTFSTTATSKTMQHVAYSRSSFLVLDICIKRALFTEI